MKINEKIVKGDFSKFNKEKLIKDFNQLNLCNEIEKMKTLDKKYYLLHENITYVFNKNAPIHEISNRHKNSKRKS